MIDNFLWIFSDLSLDVQQYGDLPAWEFMHVQMAVPASVNPAYDAFVASWPTATTIYDEVIHGVYNATTHAPLFDHNEVFFDTDYGPVGDGVPDVWGMYVYDTVVLYANSVKDVLDQGESVHDGAVLKEALISTSQEMVGVTGEMAFDRESQDRDSVYRLDAWVGPQALVRRSELACVALAANFELRVPNQLPPNGAHALRFQNTAPIEFARTRRSSFWALFSRRSRAARSLCGRTGPTCTTSASLLVVRLVEHISPLVCATLTLARAGSEWRC